jgi:hypothetical protein
MIIKHQQMHLRIIKKFNIFLETLLHVSAPRCHPQGALNSWLKLIIVEDVRSKSELKLIKLIN